MTRRCRALQYAELIQSIIRNLECRPEFLIRVPCPYCHCGQVMLLDPQHGTYECQACGRHGKLQQLTALASDRFEYRHRETMALMRERAAVEKVAGRR